MTDPQKLKRLFELAFTQPPMIDATLMCPVCEQQLVHHDGSWSGWVHSLNFKENTQLVARCNVLRSLFREFDPRFHRVIRHSVQWLDTKEWGSKIDRVEFCKAIVDCIHRTQQKGNPDASTCG